MENENKQCGSGACANFPRKYVSAALILLSVFLLAKSFNEFKRYSYVGRENAQQTTIYVAGQGEKIAVPDIATFSFGVTEESMSIAEAQNKAATTTNSILAFLKKSGVQEKDIKMTGYNIYPRYEYNEWDGYSEKGKRILAAYVVSENVEVKVRTISDAGKLIGGIGELGANNISGLTFGFDKDESLRAEARALAIKDAQEKARSLAKDLGVRLVKIVSFSENQIYPMYAMSEKVAYGRGGGAAVPDVPVGEDKIVSNVNITYEIR